MLEMIKSGKGIQEFMTPDGKFKEVPLPEKTQEELAELEKEVKKAEKEAKMEVSELVQDAQLVMISTHICNENLKGKDGEAILEVEQIAQMREKTKKSLTEVKKVSFLVILGI